MPQRVCEVCESGFEGRRDARFCSATCRKRSSRGADGAPDDGLVRSVRKELEDADRLESFAGQLALQLAREMAAPGATGIAAMSKELRVVMADALGGRSGSQGEPESDVVNEIKERRERKAREAARLA